MRLTLAPCVTKVRGWNSRLWVVTVALGSVTRKNILRFSKKKRKIIGGGGMIFFFNNIETKEGICRAEVVTVMCLKTESLR